MTANEYKERTTELLSSTINLLNIRATHTDCCNYPNTETVSFYYRVMCLKDAVGIASSVDPDQTAPRGLLAQTCLSENLGSLRY